MRAAMQLVTNGAQHNKTNLLRLTVTVQYNVQWAEICKNYCDHWATSLFDLT